MRLFKTSYRDKDGQTRQVKKWWVELRDHLQTVRRFSAFTDKTQSEALGRQIERLVRYRAAGEQPDAALSRWLEQIPGKLRQRFADIGLLDPERASGGKSLSEHLTDFQHALADKGNTTAQVEQTVAKVKRIVEGCKFRAWSDISAKAVSRFLSDLESTGGLSKRTRNYYLKAIKHFCRWMVRQRRASQSPLEYLDCVSVKAGDTRHERRALELDEIRRLLETTVTQPTRFGMSGYERALLYRLAIETGLRANELRSLLVGSFDFDRQTVTVESQHTKNHKEAVLPLRPDTAAELKQFLVGKLPSVKAFGGTYKSLTDKTAEMIKADLAKAGISYCDESGRYADFHSLRHTTGSLLAASGVHPKTAQSIMRHSTIDLTMSRYTHIFGGQEAQAVASLPDFSTPSTQAQKAVATGTDGKDVLVFRLALPSAGHSPTTPSSETVNRTSAVNNAVSNTPGRIRTCDLRIRNPLLYPTELRAQPPPRGLGPLKKRVMGIEPT